VARNDFGSDSFESLAAALTEMAADYDRAAETTADEFDDELRDAADALATRAERNAPRGEDREWDDGSDDRQRLAESIEVNPLDDGRDGDYEVHVAAEHAVYVVTRTDPHEITPDDAEALHFFVDGQEVFTSRVNHPGSPGNDFLADATDATRLEIVDRLRRVVDTVRREDLSNSYRSS
jgi:hypothetical protein